MSKLVKFTERVHQWGGKAIIRLDGELSEIDLGTVTTDKKLKETGVKELFKKKENVADGCIAIEVFKLDDVKTTYVMDSDTFKELAEIQDREETEINENDEIEE
jgi:hypothetical protein